MIVDYASLQTQLGDTLNRGDLTATIPLFIQMAETEFARDLLLRSALTEETHTATAETVSLPADLLQLVNVRLDTSNSGPMIRVEPHEMDRLREGAEVGTPIYYTLVGQRLSLYPVPASPGVELLITYYAALATLSVANPTNWLLLQYPDLYYYGSLKHTAPYLREDERVALWDTLYQKGKEAALLANERAEFGATPLTIRPTRTFGPGRTRNGVLLTRNP